MDKEIECHGEGNGPVNALDNAIRSGISKKLQNIIIFFRFKTYLIIKLEF